MTNKDVFQIKIVKEKSKMYKQIRRISKKVAKKRANSFHSSGSRDKEDMKDDIAKLKRLKSLGPSDILKNEQQYQRRLSKPTSSELQSQVISISNDRSDSDLQLKNN